VHGQKLTDLNGGNSSFVTLIKFSATSIGLLAANLEILDLLKVFNYLSDCFICCLGVLRLVASHHRSVRSDLLFIFLLFLTSLQELLLDEGGVFLAFSGTISHVFTCFRERVKHFKRIFLRQDKLVFFAEQSLLEVVQLFEVVLRRASFSVRFKVVDGPVHEVDSHSHVIVYVDLVVVV
jgi:hypothetical protein